MEQREFFTRSVCTVTIDAHGIATVGVTSGSMQVNIDMPASILMANVTVCDEAIAKWQLGQMDREETNVTRFRRRKQPAH